MNSQIANHINILGKFCGIRDINELSREKLFECYGIHQADVWFYLGEVYLPEGIFWQKQSTIILQKNILLLAV